MKRRALFFAVAAAALVAASPTIAGFAPTPTVGVYHADKDCGGDLSIADWRLYAKNGRFEIWEFEGAEVVKRWIDAYNATRPAGSSELLNTGQDVMLVILDGKHVQKFDGKGTELAYAVGLFKKGCRDASGYLGIPWFEDICDKANIALPTKRQSDARPAPTVTFSTASRSKSNLYAPAPTPVTVRQHQFN